MAAERADRAALAPLQIALAATAFLIVGFIVYAPALDGAFFSDDSHYVHANPYLHELSLANLIEIWNPTSVVASIVENYAPVHLMLHAFEWQLFGTEVRGYHAVNVAFHALVSVLLVLVFMRSGIPRNAALAAGAFFLVHPANVEAVAWIAQIKTPASMAAMLGALLLHPRRPRAALLSFAVALLAKPTAVVALPVVLAWGWTRARGEGRVDWRWGWLGAWAVAFVLFAVAEFAAFYDTAGQAPPIYPELDVRLRSVCAIALRYLVQAVSGSGLSVFHETPAARSWLDPWWLGSLAMMGAIAARAVFSWRERLPELGYWVWLVVAFGPISGVIPLPFPMADRYLYFILPGLLGAGLLLGERHREAFDAVASRPWLVTGLVALLVLGFGFRANVRARTWESPQLLMADAERHYPDGAAARTRQATRAARAGDIDAAVAALRDAMARGYNRLDHLLQEPAYGPYREDEGFAAILDDLARDMVERFQARSEPSQIELRALAQAYIVLGDSGSAERALARAVERGGPLDVETRDSLEALRRQRRIDADARRRRERREAG